MEFDQILPNLFVGSCPKTADDVKTLQDQGITAVVNLQSDDDFQVQGIEWSAMRAGYFASRIDARRVPITDFDDDDLREKMVEAVRVLGELIDDGRVVLVHCNVGVNRSPSTAICYLHWMAGWTLDDAESHLRKCRNCSPVMEVVRLATRDRARM